MIRNRNSKKKFIIIAGLIVLCLIIYVGDIGYNRYSYLNNSLNFSLGSAILDITDNSSKNKNMAKDILKNGKIEKNEALLFSERDTDILNEIGMFSNITDTYTKTKVNMRQFTEKFLLQQYDKNFLSFSGSSNEFKVLTDNDRSYLKGKIIIYDIISKSQEGFIIDTKNAYVKNDMWLKWYTKLSQRIINLNLKDITK